MAVWLCLRWWYTAGWQWAFKRALVQRLRWCNDTFSIAPLLRTLFAPFKQTKSQGNGSLGAMFRASIDNLVSRFVGLIARSFIIVAGLICAVFVLITGVLFIILWPFIPLALPIALGFMISGVGR